MYIISIELLKKRHIKNQMILMDMIQNKSNKIYLIKLLINIIQQRKFKNDSKKD